MKAIIPTVIALIILSGCQALQMVQMDHGSGASHEGEHAAMTEHQTTGQQATERQAEVAEKGAEVMPFDLDATTHIFEKNADGGLQQVIADNPADSEQIVLIRSHLAEEAERFQQGDFHDPAMIHGDDMAGLHALMMGAGQIEITYSDLPDGAQILYTTTDAELIDAIHSWFDAQVSDHGQHATDQR